MLAVKHNIPQIKNKLKRLMLLVGKGKPNVQEDFKKMMLETEKEVTRRTPRSRSNVFRTAKATKALKAQVGKHVADGWTTHFIGGGGKDRVPMIGVVYNQFTHKQTGEVKTDARLTTERGEIKSYSILEVLEYGSPPHPITPVNAKVLHFISRSGEEFFVKSVQHPGTRPYSMVRRTRATLKIKARKLAQKWSRKVLQDWKRA